jgi:hypothetical protein
MPEIIAKKFNAERSAERLTLKTGQTHCIVRADGGWRVTLQAPVPAVAQAAVAALAAERPRTIAERRAKMQDKEDAKASRESRARRLATEAAMAADEAPAAPAASPAKDTAEVPARRNAKLADAQARAARGELPEPPNFEADTHKPFRAKRETLIRMAERGDAEGLRGFEIKATSTSPKALARYRDLCLIALAAKAAR